MSKLKSDSYQSTVRRHKMNEQLGSNNVESQPRTPSTDLKPEEIKQDHCEHSTADGEEWIERAKSSLQELRQFREELSILEKQALKSRLRFQREFASIQNMCIPQLSSDEKEVKLPASDENSTRSFGTKSGFRLKRKPRKKETVSQGDVQPPSHENIAKRNDKLKKAATQAITPNDSGTVQSSKADCIDKLPVVKANTVVGFHSSSVHAQSEVDLQNDAAATENSHARQVCSAFNGDVNYHYENIDDFDDTNKDNSSMVMKTKIKAINCKFVLDKSGVFSPVRNCDGKEKRGYYFNKRRYILGEILRQGTTVTCYKKGCSNVYDPWDVARFIGTKDAYQWYENIAFDPLKSNYVPEATGQSLITGKNPFVNDTQKEGTPPAVPGKPLKKRWWQRKSKPTKKQNDPPVRSQTSTKEAFSASTSEETNSSTTLLSAETEAKQHKYECETCLEGFNDDPQKGYNTCGHFNCKTCLKTYFNQQIRNMIAEIECPRPDCSQEFDCRFIMQLLTREHKIAYVRLRRIRRELEYFHKENQSKRECPNGFHCTDSKCVCKTALEPESWIEKSKTFGYCPKCGTLIQKTAGGCTVIFCRLCKTEFCWVCKKLLLNHEKTNHMLRYSIYGHKKYSKGRVIFNYLSLGTFWIIIGGPLLLGGSAVAMAALGAVGAVSPPYLLAKKVHDYNKSKNISTTKRNVSIIAAASLGVLALPILSLWGINKTLKSSLNSLGQWIDEHDDEVDKPVNPPKQVN